MLALKNIPAGFAILLFTILFAQSSCNKDAELDTIATENQIPDTAKLHTDTTKLQTDIDNIKDTTNTADTLGEPQAKDSNYAIYCSDYKMLDLVNGCKLSNNVWGYESANFDDYSQCIFYDKDQPETFGWKWDLTGTCKYPSFPRVGWGWNPWDKSKTTDILPRQIKSISALTIAFEQELTAEGLNNTAFDIWITSPDSVYSDSIVGEIMIWTEATQKNSAELIASNISIGSGTYDFYKNTTWSDIPYMAFVQKNGAWNGQLDIMPFANYLAHNGHLSAEAHIAEVEFGNEIWSGSGCMKLKNFSVSVE